MKINIKRSQRKTMSIIVRDGGILVRAPHFVSDHQIDEFVLSKQKWIQTKLQQYRPMGFNVSMKTLRVYGTYRNVVIECESKFSMYLTDSLLVINRPASMSDQRVEELVELHFKTELERLLKERIKFFASQLQIKTPDFTVRRYKRLYGRCSKDHHLGFNTYLYHDHLSFIDYVVLHECAHILEFNHSQRFYDHIQRIMPDYREIIAANKT